MSDENPNQRHRNTDDASRRPRSKKDAHSKEGALTTAGEGMTTSGTAAAQMDENEGDDDEISDVNRFRVAMFQSDFRGGGRFIITSSVIEWTPDVPVNLGGSLTAFNTHIAAYLNTVARFPLFIAQEANVEARFDKSVGYFVDQDEFDETDGFLEPAVYQLENRFSFYGETDRIITAYAYRVEEEVEEGLFESGEEVDDFLF